MQNYAQSYANMPLQFVPWIKKIRLPSSIYDPNYDSLFDIVASAPLAFITPSPEFCDGIAMGLPLSFDVKLTSSFSIRSRVSRVRSSTSAGVKPFVSIGFSTTKC